MKFNRLINQYQKENGEFGYKMATYEIEVIARNIGGHVPNILYFHDNQDVTDDIKAIRYGIKPPYSYIDDYDKFQKILYKKEQQAMNNLYELIKIRPKKLSSTKQLLWSFGVLILMTIPLLVAFILK